MEMIRVDRQREKCPSLLFAFYVDEVLTTIFELARENGLSSLGTPDEMVHNEVYSVLISLILKLAIVCRYHLGNLQYFRQTVKPNGLLAQAREKLAYPPEVETSRLAAGSTGVIIDLLTCFK
jgi:hypothetical protein